MKHYHPFACVLVLALSLTHLLAQPPEASSNRQVNPSQAVKPVPTVTPPLKRDKRLKPSASTHDKAALNPQPIPPGRRPNDAALNPQPIPPGRRPNAKGRIAK